MTETTVPEAPKPAVLKIVQNGVTRPQDGTKTGRVWAIADQLSDAANAPAARKAVLEVCVAEGINAATGATQYGKWRVFHGLVKAPATPSEAPTPEAPAEENEE